MANETVSEHCRRTHEQHCHRCEDLKCCDNTNEDLKRIAALESENATLRSALAECNAKATELIALLGDKDERYDIGHGTYEFMSNEYIVLEALLHSIQTIATLEMQKDATANESEDTNATR